MRKPRTVLAKKSTLTPILRIGSGRKRIERFESLVDELSAAMARVREDGLGKEIEKWLSEIVLALDLDRAAVFERGTSDGGFVSLRWWARPGIPGLPPETQSMRISTWATREILAGRSIVFSSLDELPKEAVKYRRFLKSHGPRAQVILPLQIGSEVIGGLTLGKFRGPRHWSPKELQHLRIVGQIVAVALDRKRAALESRKLQEELAVASRRSTMGELTASIARELNRPLGAILSNLGGLARLLSQGNPNPSIADTAVRNAIEDTKRAGEIVRRFRGMFRGDETRKVAIDIRALVEEVVKMTGGEATSREVTLRIDGSSQLPSAIGDRVQIQQCVLNLLMNALDASAQTKSEPREVVVTVAPEKAGWIQVGVSDNGAGVDPTIVDRIFEPFVTSRTNGMGLGLLVTKSIVEDHGGKIWFSPNPAGGATFIFTLPIGEAKRARASRHAQ
jgi:signal transduction histidine kinase